MKVFLYSNRLDNLYNQISNKSDKMSSLEFFNLKNNIKDINNIYNHEEEMYTKYSRNSTFRKKLKNDVHTISDFLLGMKGNKKIYSDRKSILNNVIERNKKERNRINFEVLTVRLGQKFLKRDVGSNQNSCRSNEKKTSRQVRKNTLDQTIENSLNPINFTMSPTIHSSIKTNKTICNEENKQHVRDSSPHLEKEKKNITSKRKRTEKGISMYDKKKILIPEIEKDSEIHDIKSNKGQLKMKKKIVIPEIEIRNEKDSEAYHINSNKYALKIKKNNLKNLEIKKIVDDNEKSKVEDKEIKSKTILKKQNEFVADEKNIESYLSTKFDTNPKLKQISSPLKTPTIENEEFDHKNSSDTEINQKTNKSIRLEKMDDSSNKSELLPNSPTPKIENKSQQLKRPEIQTTTRNKTKKVSIIDKVVQTFESPIKDEKMILTSPNVIKELNFASGSKQQKTTRNIEENLKLIEETPKENLKIKSFTSNIKRLNSVRNSSPSTRKETKRKTKNKKSSILPFFKNGIALNKFLIRDFLIGDASDIVGNSKKKLELTIQMYEYLEAKKRQKIQEEREAFEIEKYGGKIIGEPAEDLNRDMNELKISKQDENLKGILKEMDRIDKNKIIERSKKVGELIENLSNSSYEEIESQPKKTISHLVNQKNLERVIRVRNIMKKKVDLENDIFGIQDIDKFKKQRRENDNELMMTLKSLGPPSFLKTRFKNSTIEKYKIVNGRYFGCMV